MRMFSLRFSIDPEVRLSHFERVCRRAKTTDTVSSDDLLYIRHFLYLNVNIVAEGHRKRLVTGVKYLLIQLKVSGYSIWKERDEDEILDSTKRNLICYEAFIQWLVQFCFYCLRLRGSYSRRAAALYILDLIYCSDLLEDSLRHAYVTTWNLDSSWTAANVDVLLDTLTDSYESNQLLALKLLKRVPDRHLSSHTCSTLLETAFEWCSASKTQYPETAVYYFLLALERCDLNSQLAGNERDSVNFRSVNWSQKERNCFLLCRRLLTLLQERTDAAEKDLIKSALEGPPWGLLRSLAYVVKEVDWSAVKCQQESLRLWQVIIQELLRLCHRLATIVSPIVNSSSPEGYMPDVSNDDRDEAGIDYGAERSHRTMCQAVLVCSWRTQKEVSAIFGHLSNLHSASILTLDDLVSMGDYFLIQLTECKHRGAFECAYAAFSAMCASIRKSKNDVVRELPRRWLGKIMDGLISLADGKDDGGGINYCATRRSAGVPFLVQAVLATEPKNSYGRGSPVFYDTLLKLLRILFQEDASRENEQAKVHSMNILRALLKESKLGLSCVTPPWLSMIAQGNLLLFSHRSWDVRNSATLLFSSWIVRVFGVSRNRDEISPKNKMSIADFDSLCPDLLDFMLQLLRQYTEARTNRSSVPFQELVLFPILSILARLHPSARSTNILRSFIPCLLDALISCPVISVRRSAATALCSVMDESELASLMQNLLRLVNDGRLSQNAANGVLLLAECRIRASGRSDVNCMRLDSLNLCPLNLSKAAKLISSGNQFARFTTAISLGQCSSHMSALREEAVCQVSGLSFLLANFESNARVRCEFYKQWRSLFKKSDGYRDQLMELAKKICKPGLVWQDVTGCHSSSLKLQKQACKFCLCLPHLLIDQDGRVVTQTLLRLYQNSTQAHVRRHILHLACQRYFSFPAWMDDELSDALIQELDAASKHERSCDDRWMVLTCLTHLNTELLGRNHVEVSIILIRLLTDAEDVIRDEAAKLCSLALGLDCAVQPSLALLIIVVRLISTDSLHDGKGRRAFCQFLLEIADEFAQAMEANSEERIFEKSEPNTNLEPLLLAEWLRLATTGTFADIGKTWSDADIVRILDRCSLVDGIKTDEFVPSMRNQCKESVSCHVLREAVSRVLGNDF